MNTQAYRGFTLLEVMVALAVLSIALGAALAATDNSVRHVDIVTDRLLAHWVAMNQIAEIELGLHATPGDRLAGSEDMGGRHFLWSADLTPTPDRNVQHLTMRVRSSTSSPLLAELDGFLGMPP